MTRERYIRMTENHAPRCRPVCPGGTEALRAPTLLLRGNLLRVAAFIP